MLSLMWFFLLIFILLPVMNIGWWYWADRRLRPLPHSRWWRLGLAAFGSFNLLFYAWMMISRRLHVPLGLPPLVTGLSYIWHLVVLPATTAILLMLWLVLWSTRGVRRRLPPLRAATVPGNADPDPPAQPETAVPKDADPVVHQPQSELGTTLSRRALLAAGAVAIPPLVTAAAHARASYQLGRFRTRRIEIPLAGLPRTLDGMTIAHVSDIHVGRFSSTRMLNDLVDRTNALKADLVLLTGDLIDFALADLPSALDTVKRLDPRHGLLMIEGNHDLFENPREFERRVLASGVPLLLNQSAMLKVRGQNVQILGLRWGQPAGAHGSLIAQSMDQLVELRRLDAFTILMAHHPHAFDPAAEAGIPLTLAGHTHGGQLMLTRHIGAGSLLFKYISGLYRRNQSALVVSNGVGNWFPLRINAPAELVHLTLRSLPSPA